MQLLFIIGMQKSGTSLLNRMLMQHSFINNPFLPEGKFFWGDNPPFSPEDKPCGELYQNKKGQSGHYLDQQDYNPIDQKLLQSRIEEANVTEDILMNKNPYNTVRIQWLKKMFPECKIVAMYRNPVSNVFSLLKRHVKSDKGVGPENGWWGIKPKDWLTIQSEDKLVQSAQQWNSVNKQLLEDIDKVEMIVNYDTLCQKPQNVIKQSIQGLHYEGELCELPVCKNMNDEYKYGSRLLSKNRELRKNTGFDLSRLIEEIEFPAFTDPDVKKIKVLTNNIWNRLQASPKNIRLE